MKGDIQIKFIIIIWPKAPLEEHLNSRSMPKMILYYCSAVLSLSLHKLSQSIPLPLLQVFNKIPFFKREGATCTLRLSINGSKNELCDEMDGSPEITKGNYLPDTLFFQSMMEKMIEKKTGLRLFSIPN